MPVVMRRSRRRHSHASYARCARWLAGLTHPAAAELYALLVHAPNGVRADWVQEHGGMRSWVSLLVPIPREEVSP